MYWISKLLKKKSAFLKIVPQAFEAGDFLNIIFRVLGFLQFFQKKVSYKKLVWYLLLCYDKKCFVLCGFFRWNKLHKVSL